MREYYGLVTKDLCAVQLELFTTPSVADFSRIHQSRRQFTIAIVAGQVETILTRHVVCVWLGPGTPRLFSKVCAYVRYRGQEIFPKMSRCRLLGDLRLAEGTV